jgi:hypothetical protein
MGAPWFTALPLEQRRPLPCTLDWCDAMAHVCDRSIGRSAREQTNDLHGAKALYSKATELDPKNDAAQVLFVGMFYS